MQKEFRIPGALYAGSMTKDSPRPSLKDGGWSYACGRAIREFWLDSSLDKAAMLTFFTVLSFAPTLLATYSIATLFLANNADLVESLLADFIRDYVPGTYQETVREIVMMVIGTAAGGVMGLIAGILVALWSASAYVRAFSRCVNSIYGLREGRTLIRNFATQLATTLVLLLGMVLIASSIALNEVVVSTVLGPFAEPLGLTNVLDYLLSVFLPIWVWVRWPVIVLLTIVLIAVLYYFTPNVKQPRFRWLSLGASVAMVGLALVSGAFYLYLLFLTGLSSYGAIGTVLALLFALWGGNISLLLGVTVDAEVERARQLREGVVAEENIQLPLRSTRALERQDQTKEMVIERGRELREESLGAD